MVTKINGKLLGSNLYIIKNDNQALIVDAGASVKEIKQHLTGEKVVGVLLTHLHFDHSLFLKEICAEFECNAFVSKHAKSFLKNPNDITLANAFGVQVELPNSFEWVSDGMLTIGEFNLTAFLTPGHSPDSACFLIGSMLFCGDTLFLDAIGRTDLKHSSVSKMIDSLKTLKEVKFNVALSGHGKQSDYFTQQKNIEFFIDLLQEEFNN